MSRQNISTGQQSISQDIDDLQGRGESTILDRVIHEMLGRKTDSFFGDSFVATRLSSVSVQIKAGLGVQFEDTGTKEPVQKLMALDTDLTVNINTPDPVNPRIDIVVVKNDRKDLESEDRKFKDEFSDTVTEEATVISTKWSSDVLYVAGAPAGSPAAPAVPAGYIKVATLSVAASTGIPVSGGITDDRNKLPICFATTETGSSEYDAIVGNVGVDQGANYGDLKSALDNAEDGWKILVIKSEAVNAIPVVTKNDIEITFKRGITVSKGTAGAGLQIDGNDCKVNNSRFLNFSVATNYGIIVSVGASRTYLNAPRFNNCDQNINDLGDETFINVEYTE